MTRRQGLYLAAPHGRLVHEEKKHVIATGRKFPITGERVVCSKEDGIGLAFGIALIDDPVEVDANDFGAHFSEHRVSESSRLKWWSDKPHLYLYRIKRFDPFPEPVEIAILPGTIMNMGEVDFPFDITPDAGDPHLVIPGTEGTILTEDKAMPWKPSDALGYIKKANTPERQKLWADTANARLKACTDDGGEREECESSAIKVANAAVSRQKSLDLLSLNEDDVEAFRELLMADNVIHGEKAGDDGEGEAHTCTCPNCKESSESDVPCSEAQCPECSAQTRGGDDGSSKAKQEKPDDEEEDEEEDEDDEEDEKKPKKKDVKAGRRLSAWAVAKVDKIKAGLAELLAYANYDDQKEPEVPDVIDILAGVVDGKGFKSLGSDDQGNDWFIVWPTNAYFDREQEAFATPAIKEYVARHRGNDVKGVVDFAHIPGSEFGTVREQADVADHFVCQLCTYDKTPIGNAFKAFFEKYPESHPELAPAGWGASHQFNYKSEDRDGGVFTVFDIEKSTVLPLHEAANVFNPQPTMGGLKMNEQEKERIDAIGASVGVPGLADAIVAQGLSAKGKLDEAGVPRKSLDGKEQVPNADKSQDGDGGDPMDQIVDAVAERLGLQQLSDQFVTLTAAIPEMQKSIGDLSAQIQGVQQADEEKLAKSIGSPRYGWQSGFQASVAPETKTSGEPTQTKGVSKVVAALAAQGPMG